MVDREMWISMVEVDGGGGPPTRKRRRETIVEGVIEDLQTTNDPTTTMAPHFDNLIKPEALCPEKVKET